MGRGSLSGLSRPTFDASAGLDGVAFETLDPIALKGYADPVPNFAARLI